MQPRPLRWQWPLAALVAIGLAGQARAADPIQVEGLRVGMGQTDLYKVGTWTPLRVQLKAGPADFSGFLEVTVPDDNDTPTVFRRAVSVKAETTEWFTTYARPGSPHAPIALQLKDTVGRRQGPEVLSSSLPKTQDIKTLGGHQILIVTMGKTQGVEAIPTLSGFGADDTSRNERLVEVAPIRVPDGLPGRPYGYDAADAVVIDTNDKEVMDALDAGRGEALKTWVRNGGHIVVAVGSNWQQVRDSVLEPMLPAVPNGRTQLDDLRTLESFAGSTKPITKALQPVTVTKLEVKEGRGGKPLDSTTAPLVVRGPYGFGLVTVVALDVDQKPFTTWEDRALFWIKVIGLRRSTDEAGNVVTTGGGGRSMYQTNVTDLSTLLHSALEQFPGVKLVPFGWVAFFIFLYILLIGPGDYLFLKRVLKRMELTWITFPTIVLTVSLLAYYAAYAVKGTELRINKVDAVDVDQVSGLVRGSTWFTLFSPQNHDYTLAVEPQPIRRSADPGTQPKNRGDEYNFDTNLTWFGVPEFAFGGMNNSSRLGLSGAAYEYAPVGAHQAPDKPEMLRQVRVPIWSTKSFIGRWTGQQGAKVVDAELEMVGTDRLSGTITNRMAKPLRNAILAFGKQVYYDLGTIEPGASVQIELKNNRTLAGFLESQNANLPTDTWNQQRLQISRPDLVRTLMFRDGGGSRATALASNPLRYLDLSGQLALDRPMLVAVVDDPASTLFLGDESRTPKIEQTTLLRVILPLGKPKDEATTEKADGQKSEAEKAKTNESETDR